MWRAFAPGVADLGKVRNLPFRSPELTGTDPKVGPVDFPDPIGWRRDYSDCCCNGRIEINDPNAKTMFAGRDDVAGMSRPASRAE